MPHIRRGDAARSPRSFGLAAAVTAHAAPAGAADRTFDGDLAFLRKHVEVVLLQDAATGARVAVVPAWQGRVMTSATGGASANGFGWINEELVASRALRPHINAFGGEDRLWLGPEGGQFSIFFRKGDPFDLEHWQTPPLVDTEPWAVASKDTTTVVFHHRGRLVNYSGTPLDVAIDRAVRLLSREDAAAAARRRPAGRRPRRRVRLREHARQRRTGRVDPGGGCAVAVDPRHVPAVAADDDRRTVRARPAGSSSGRW